MSSNSSKALVASTSSLPANNNHNNMSRNTSASSNHNTLPKSIEGAVARYMNVYKTNFVGQHPSEMNRLRDLLEVKLAKLRRKAPEFYDRRLCPLIIQAASTLLTCNMKTNQGQKNFHETHRELCIVLDNLLQTQPAGEADFPTERRRVQERDSLNRQHIELRRKLDELDATELDLYDEDELNQFYTRREKLERDLSAVCKLIAEMEGVETDKWSRKFELVINKHLLLRRLSPDQFEHLETQIAEYLMEEGLRARMDKGVVDNFIQLLDLSENRFTKEDLVDLAKETLDAIREFYRLCDKERMNEYYDTILKSDILKPKEGLILESHDHIPPELAEKLDNSAKNFDRQVNATLEKFAEQQGDNYNAIGDIVDENDRLALGPNNREQVDESCEDLANDSDDDLLELERYEKAFINKYKQENPELFTRVKEEPRDDYTGDCPSGDEIELDEEDAYLLDPSLTLIPRKPLSQGAVVNSTTSSSTKKTAGGTAVCEDGNQSNSEPEVIEINSDSDDDETPASKPKSNPTPASHLPPTTATNNRPVGPSKDSTAPIKDQQPQSTNKPEQRIVPPPSLSDKSSANINQLPHKSSSEKKTVETRQSSESSGVFNDDDEEDDDDDIQELGVVEPSAKRPCIQLE